MIKCEIKIYLINNRHRLKLNRIKLFKEIKERQLKFKGEENFFLGRSKHKKPKIKCLIRKSTDPLGSSIKIYKLKVKNKK